VDRLFDAYKFTVANEKAEKLNDYFVTKLGVMTNRRFTKKYIYTRKRDYDHEKSVQHLICYPLPLFNLIHRKVLNVSPHTLSSKVCSLAAPKICISQCDKIGEEHTILRTRVGAESLRIERSVHFGQRATNMLIFPEGFLYYPFRSNNDDDDRDDHDNHNTLTDILCVCVSVYT
jgi:hypothetical protein